MGKSGRGDRLGHQSTQRDELLADAKAALEFRTDRSRQMPDPCWDSDIGSLARRGPKLATLRRLIEHQSLINPAGTPWGSRKSDRSCREMTDGNPYVQIDMRRALRTTCEWLVENGSEHSHANRIVFRRLPGAPATAAVTASYRQQFPKFRRKLMAMAKRNRVAVMADARRLYPSISAEFIYHRMRHTGASDGDALAVLIHLERARVDTGIPGLPIGDETSGWLAELAMHNTHRALDQIPDLDYVRWSDDAYFGNGARVVAELGLEAYQEALKDLGTFVAPEKTRRSWDLGITPLEMVRNHWPSNGDILFGKLGNDSLELVRRLAEIVVDGRSDQLQLMKSLLTLASGRRDLPQHPVREIVARMLDEPVIWEQCCRQACAFAQSHATPEQRAEGIRVAFELASEGFVGCEQRVALFRLIDTPNSLPEADRGPLARALLAHARRAEAVPERQWARATAYKIDPHLIERATIETGEFDDLHAFEQRTAIAFADPRRNHWWLERQEREGRWPTAARARCEGWFSVAQPRQPRN